MHHFGLHTRYQPALDDVLGHFTGTGVELCLECAAQQRRWAVQFANGHGGGGRVGQEVAIHKGDGVVRRLFGSVCHLPQLAHASFHILSYITEHLQSEFVQILEVSVKGIRIQTRLTSQLPQPQRRQAPRFGNQPQSGLHQFEFSTGQCVHVVLLCYGIRPPWCLLLYRGLGRSGSPFENRCEYIYVLVAVFGKRAPNQPAPISEATRAQTLTLASITINSQPPGHTGQQSVTQGQTPEPEYTSVYPWRYTCVYRS